MVENKSDASIYNNKSETGSTGLSFANAISSDQIVVNFAYDYVSITNMASQRLNKNRLVKKTGGNPNLIYPVYNKKEFFIALNNSDRLNTKISGGTVFYYIINANEVDVDTIILPDISASISFVIKNISGRPYQIKTLSGVLVHTLLPSSANNQKLFTYTGAPYTVTTDSINFDSDVNFGFDHGDQKNHVPTSIKSANQYIELDQSHPLLALFDVDGAIKDAKTIFKDTDFDLTINSSTSKYRISDVYSTVTASNLPLIYCYGRKPLILDNLTKYIVNDFYLFVEHGGVAVDNEQFYLPSDLTGDGVLNTGAQDLNIIDENHIDLTRFFENQTQIAALPNVIFIPITKYSSKFYLPNLQAKVPSTVSGSFVELSSLLAGKKILFVNLIESDSSGYNSIYNYSNATTTNLQDVNSIALFSVSGGSWTKDTSSLPQVKKVFATLKNIKGIGDTSNTEVTKGKEFIYLPNFNRFNLSLQSVEDRSFRDFYVFNSCKYTIYINSDATLLSSAAFTRIAKDQTSGNFIGIGLDQGSSSVFSVIEKNYAEGKTPEDLDKLINDIPSLVGIFFKDKNYNTNIFSATNIEKIHKNNLLITDQDINNLKNYFYWWDKKIYEEKKIIIYGDYRTISQFLTSDDLPASNPPWGYIAKLDIVSGKILYKSPIGFIDNNLIGTTIFGGIAISGGNLIFANGTEDGKAYVLKADNGEILWTFQMEAAGSAPPTIFNIDNKQYVSFLATGGGYYSYKKRGSTLYTFSIN